MPGTVPIYDVQDFDAQLANVAELLRGGGVVVLPTETVYGAAGLLNQPMARDRLRALRGAGGEGRPFTVHLARRDDAYKYLDPVNELGRRMIKKLWPGPLALTFDVPERRRKEVAGELGVNEADIYDGGTITLRFPDNLVAHLVLEQVPGPVALTLAHGPAHEPALSGDQIADEFHQRVDLVVNAGPTRFTKPSTIVRVYDDRYEIVREGVYDARIIERLLRTTILFVCSGNTCRSPMAEGIARRVIADKMHVTEDDLEKKGVSVVSAGSFAMPGARAAPQAVEALRPMGVDLTRHRSRPLTVELIHQADVIYTMGRSHAEAVRSLVPSSADKVVPLNPQGEIDDPIGSDLSTYQSVAGQLQTLIEKRLEERSW
ncbi:MAG: Sua5/YciO/YrdC/YwlC family protein [Tepidisphaeraceae bacterium]